MKRIVLILCLSFIPLLASIVKPLDIDITKKGLTIGTYTAYSRALTLAKKFSQYDTYIKKTTTTKEPYYVVYIVNIPKFKQYSLLKKIKENLPTAYITSDSRIKQLHNDMQDDAISITNKIDKKYIKKIVNIKSQVNIHKKAISVTYTNDKKNLQKIEEKLKGYDLFIKKSILSDNYIVYAVNIDKELFESALENIKAIYPKAQETSKERLRYFVRHYTKYDKFIGSRLKTHLLAGVIHKKRGLNKELLQKYNLAKEYFNKKQYRKSIDILTELSAADPSNTNINFYLGRSYYELKKYEQASAAFERITISDETNLRARVELAQTYMQLKLTSEALKNFNYVLEQNIPKLVRDNILQKIAYIKSLKKKNFVSGTFSVDVTFDDNVNQKNGEPTYTINGITADQAPIRGDTVYTYNTTFSHVYKIDDKHIVNTTVNYNAMRYNNDGKRKDDQINYTILDIEYEAKKKLDVISGSNYYTVMGKRYIFGIGVDQSYIKSAGHHLFKTYGIGINYSKKFYSKISIFSILKYFKKEYQADDSKNQNSKNTQIMLGNTYPTIKYGEFSLVYLYTHEHLTNADMFGVSTHKANSDTHGLILSHRYKLSNALTLTSMGMYTYMKKDSLEPPYTTIQVDRSSNFSVGLEDKLSRKMILTLSAKVASGNSTIDIYDYKKHTVTMGLKFLF